MGVPSLISSKSLIYCIGIGPGIKSGALCLAQNLQNEAFMQIFSILARTNQQILERASWETASNKYHFALYERKDAGKIPFLHCLSICNPFVWRHTYFRERKWKDNLKDGVNLNIFFSEGKADGRTRKVLWKLGQYGLC